MPFTTELVPVVIEPSGLYVTTADVIYQGNQDTFTIPSGFQTDLASVPQFMTWLVPVAGVQDRAALLHDFLCEVLGGHQPRPDPCPSPSDVDGIFRRVLGELGVPAIRRYLFWAGVRWGALFSRHRRPGWWSDAPSVLGISLLALPVVLPASIVVGGGLLLYGLAEGVARGKALLKARSGTRRKAVNTR
jgi:hypothetical protein